MNFTENDIKQLFAAFSILSDKVEELEAKLAKLQGKKKCMIIEMKPKINKL